MRNGFGEIVVLMALRTGEFRVLAMKGKLGAAMIETGNTRNRFPASGGVATLAGTGLSIYERTMMRIGMAILTLAKNQPFILGGRLTRLWPMAFFARGIDVQSGEWKLRAAVLETVGRLPGVLRVAA